MNEAKAGKAGAINALVKLVEQHLGRIGPSTEEVRGDENTLTTEQWALLRQAVLAEEAEMELSGD